MDAQHPATPDQILALIRKQPFAVLCTQGQGQPYGSVVAYAVTPDLSSAVFATPRSTHKYRLLCECDRVALVIDSRPALPEEMMEAEAITATGQAVALPSGPAFDRLAALLTERHPQLVDFVTDASSALFRVDVGQYVHVTRFQQVHRWTP